MRVLHVISGGDTGGGKTHVLTLLSELQKRIDARLICFMEGPFATEARELGLSIEVLEQSGRQDLSVLRTMVERIRSQHIDVVHSHGARSNFLVALARPSIRVPMVTTLHSDYRLDFRGNPYKHLVYTTLNSLSLRFFDEYIVVSEELRRLLNRRGVEGKYIHSVRNYLFGRVKHVTRTEFLTRSNLAELEGVPLVGVLGRLYPVKGQEVFLRAAAAVGAHFPEVRFLLGGDGDNRPALQALAKALGLGSRAVFLGHIDNPYDFLNVLDVHVLCSHSETFPYVILEAAALKKPTVATAVGSVPELIIDGETGLLVPPGDHRRLAGAVMALLRQPEYASQLGEELNVRAQPYFNPTAMAERHLEVYRCVIDRGRRGRVVR